MRTILRLESLSPSLAEAYRQANDDRQRRTTLAMCLFAVEQAGLRSEEVDAALALLRRDVPASGDLQEKLLRLAAQLDERYFELSDNTENITPEASVMFQKSRAAEALALALSPNGKQRHEAIYEAIYASNDPEQGMQVAEAILRAK
jgi:hypothetical protein